MCLLRLNPAVKQRFRILKKPFQYHSLEFLDDVFVVCGIIHNILIKVNNWEDTASLDCGNSEDNRIVKGDGIVKGDDVGNVEDNDNEEDNTTLMEMLRISNDNIVITSNILSLDDNITSNGILAVNQLTWSNYDSKVQAMVDHFAYCYSKGELRWI